MGIGDIVLMVLIISGAVYLLYHSLWKKKGHCAGCPGGSCDMDEIKKSCKQAGKKIKEGVFL